jgi:enoyl-CoA hydratase
MLSILRVEVKRRARNERSKLKEFDMSNLILTENRNGVGVLTISRPEKKNAMNFAMLGEFYEQLREMGNDPEVRVLIITGTDGAFCAGTDLADLSTVPEDQRGSRSASIVQGHWWPIVECPIPVIAAVDGPAVGMGAEFATQCDIRFATPRARFAWNFAQRGLVPDMGAGTWLLPRLIGAPNALRFLYSAEFMSAEEARELGFVHQVVAPESLMETAMDLARKMMKCSPFSQRRIKSLVYEGMGSDVDLHIERHIKAIDECLLSDDHKEGVASFLERREAKFTGT